MQKEMNAYVYRLPMELFPTRQAAECDQYLNG